MIIHYFDILGPPASHRKQMRHWSLILILVWPARFPFNNSGRFPGGLRRSSIVAAASSWRSLRSAPQKCTGILVLPLSNGEAIIHVTETLRAAATGPSGLKLRVEL